MASKKGIVLTVGILVAITAASFLIWLVPQNQKNTIVISDFENNLDYVKDVHEALQETIDEEFQKMMNDEINPDEYIRIAEISSSQINSEIIQLVESNAPTEWHNSYLNYLESLRNFNSYIRETIVVANLKNDGGEQSEIQKIIENMEGFKEKSQSLSKASDEARP